MKIKFRLEDIKNSKIIKKFRKFINNKDVLDSFLAKSLASIVIWIGALIPIWLYILVRWIASPIGFWQELAIIVICGIVMGWLQVILAILAFAATIGIITNEGI